MRPVEVDRSLRSETRSGQVNSVQSQRDGSLVRPEPFSGVGPFLGVFYGPTAPGRRLFGRAGDLFRLLSRLAPHAGLSVYVFGPEGLELLPDAIAGRFHDGRQWLFRRFPPPQVVYDRALADDQPARDLLAAARDLLPRDLPLINSRPLADAAADKWLIHCTLRDHPLLAGHLPETRLVTGGGPEVVGMCLRHGGVVVKNRSGHKALGVLRVALEPDGGFLVAWNPARAASRATARGGGRTGAPPASGAIARPSPVETARIAGRAGCARLVDDLIAGREVIAQQAVAPARPGTGRSRGTGAAIEVRAIMHRTPPQGAGPDPPGRWLRTGMVCRLARGGLPFLALGQELDERPSEALPAALGPVKAGQVLDSVRRLARAVAPHLEERFGRGGELAVDFLVDASGKVWFLEVNTVPATLFRVTGAERLRRRGAERVLRHAAYLACYTLSRAQTPLLPGPEAPPE